MAVNKIRPIEVLKILGEGSQGIVALCRYKKDWRYSAANKVDTFESNSKASPNNSAVPEEAN